MEYTAAVWDPNLEYITHDIEMVQHNGVRFIFKLKGKYSIASALEGLNLETLAARREKTGTPFCLNFWQMKKITIH